MKKLRQLNVFLVAIMILVFISGQPVFAKGASVSSHASSTHSSSSTVSRTSGSGFKTGSFSSSSTTSKSSSSSKSSSISGFSSVTSSIKSVNTQSKALISIPSSYSSHSVSNNYYYNVNGGGSNFWSNYWIYRALTPEHRTYVVDNSNVVAPAYTGVKSIIPDLITIFVIIIIIGTAIYIIQKRRD